MNLFIFHLICKIEILLGINSSLFHKLHLFICFHLFFHFNFFSWSKIRKWIFLFFYLFIVFILILLFIIFLFFLLKVDYYWLNELSCSHLRYIFNIHHCFCFSHLCTTFFIFLFLNKFRCFFSDQWHFKNLSSTWSISWIFI